MIQLLMLKKNQTELRNSDSILNKTVNTLKKKVGFLESRNDFLYEEIKLLRLKLYARLSERFPDEIDEIQRSLFEDWPTEVEEVEPEEEPVVIKEHERKKSGSD